MTNIINCPVCNSKNLQKIDQKLRDSNDLNVYKCKSCTHVTLSSYEHINEAYFERGEFLLNKDFLDGIADRLRHYEHENLERIDRIGPLLVNKNVLDFGCGAGALMDKMAPLAKTIEGLEKTEPFRQYLTEKGYTIREDLEELKGPYDMITMFHVLEHLPDPVAVLKKLSKHLSPTGMIYIEVPNVNDALSSLYENDAAKEFLFFKDHLQYFSRHSLQKTIDEASLSVKTMTGHNRFGLANHLYWQKFGKPGGHKVWSFLETPQLFREYSRALAAADMSDSLIAQVHLSDF